MLERWLDVCHQYRWRLIAALIVVPCLLAAASHLIDRSQVVQVRLWVNPPVLLLNSTLDPAATGIPAPTAAALMREQLSTDAFVDHVLSTVDAGFAANPDRQSDWRRDFRASLAVASDNNDVLTLTYRTARPAYGIAVLTSLIADFEARALTSLLGQVSAPGPTGETALTAARRDVEQSLWQLENRPAPLSAELARLYLADQVRLTEANATAKAYLAVLAAGDPSTMTGTMTSLLEQGMFAVLDPPSIRPPAMTTTPLASWVWLGLAGVAGLTLLLTGWVCLGDGRVRSGADVERRTGLPYLGSTPVLDQGPV